MINIAICDDDKAFTKMVEQLLRRIAAEQGVDITCEAFFDGSSLVKAATKDQMCFDLVYLDIEMDDTDGIRAALALRKAELPMLIVYVSGHEEHLKELFSAQPFQFLSKPIEEAAFRAVFRSACEEIGKRTGYFTFFYKRAPYRIPFDRITYFESNSRIITIHTVRQVNRKTGSQQDQFYGKISDVEKQIASLNGRFLRVHQSYLVNFDYIKTLSFTTLELLDGQKIPISEDRRREVGARFLALADMK